MAERAADTRDGVLRDTTRAEIAYARTGQILAGIVTLAAFVCAVVFFARGNNVAGGLFLGVPIVMIIRSFLGIAARGDD